MDVICDVYVPSFITKQPTFVTIKTFQPDWVPEHGKEFLEGGAGVVVGQDVLLGVLQFANFLFNVIFQRKWRNIPVQLRLDLPELD